MSAQDNFVNGTSVVYVDQLYEQWREDPNSVHASWRAYFNNVEGEAAEPYTQPPTLGQSDKSTISIDSILSALKDNQ